MNGSHVCNGCSWVVSSAPSPGSGPTGDIPQPHLVQKRRFPPPGGPHLPRTAAPPRQRHALPEKGPYIHPPSNEFQVEGAYLQSIVGQKGQILNTIKRGWWGEYTCNMHKSISMFIQHTTLAWDRLAKPPARVLWCICILGES